MVAATNQWDESRESVLRRELLGGRSANAVAKLLGTTRGAVCGKAKRLGISNLAGEHPAHRFSAPTGRVQAEVTAVALPSCGSAFRPGQAEFRAAVLANFEQRCCISGCAELGAIEAAHIIPYSASAEHDVRNGLALRADLHRLFDGGLITVENRTWKVVVSRRVICPQYRSLNGVETALGSVRAPPDRNALAWHARNIFTA